MKTKPGRCRAAGGTITVGAGGGAAATAVAADVGAGAHGVGDGFCGLDLCLPNRLRQRLMSVLHPGSGER